MQFNCTQNAAQNSDQMALKKQIQEVEFTINELMEYLDTHPYDTFAIEQYNLAAAESKTLVNQYIQKYGPLTQGDEAAGNSWSWALTNFPWDD